MNLAYVDKLTKSNNSVKYLIMGLDLFDWPEKQNEWQQNISEQQFLYFWLCIQKRFDPKKIGSTREYKLVKETGERNRLKKLCEAEGKQIYSKMSETKAAIAERTIRSSKSIFYCYKEDYEYKYSDKIVSIPHNFCIQKNLLDRFNTEEI